MDRHDLSELLLFQIVAEEASFTRAAKRLRRSQSGISQAINALENRIGVPLLARTTRNVRTTEAGQRLLKSLSPGLRMIEQGLTELKEARGGVVGSLRLTAVEYPARAIMIPHLTGFMERYPEVTVEMHVSDRLTDIVADGFDAGIRLGAHLEKDMVAVPLGTDVRAAVIAAPEYYERRGIPQRLEDLADHACLNYRLASHGDLFRWPFKQGERRVEMSVTGPLSANDGQVMIAAALAGQGLTYMFEPFVSEHLATGRLRTCLEEFCPLWSGYQLYYPGRHQKSPALAALVDYLRTSIRRSG